MFLSLCLTNILKPYGRPWTTHQELEVSMKFVLQWGGDSLCFKQQKKVNK